MMISELVMLNLIVTEMQSNHSKHLISIGAFDKENSILIVYFSDEVLDAVAEIKKLECRLLEGKGMTAEFKTYGNDLFEQFQARQK